MSPQRHARGAWLLVPLLLGACAGSPSAGKVDVLLFGLTAVGEALPTPTPAPTETPSPTPAPTAPAAPAGQDPGPSPSPSFSPEVVYSSTGSGGSGGGGAPPPPPPSPQPGLELTPRDGGFVDAAGTESARIGP